jgi:predicted HTH domain antitoxin
VYGWSGIIIWGQLSFGARMQLNRFTIHLKKRGMRFNDG